MIIHGASLPELFPPSGNVARPHPGIPVIALAPNKAHTRHTKQTEPGFPPDLQSHLLLANKEKQDGTCTRSVLVQSVFPRRSDEAGTEWAAGSQFRWQVISPGTRNILLCDGQLLLRYMFLLYGQLTSR